MSNKIHKSSQSSQTTSQKQRQLSHLHSQLAQLEANLADFENLIKITVSQASTIRSLGLNHTALFLSAHRVFEEEVARTEGDGDDVKEKEEEEKEGEAEVVTEVF